MSKRTMMVAVAVVALLVLGWLWTARSPARNPSAIAPPIPAAAPSIADGGNQSAVMEASRSPIASTPSAPSAQPAPPANHLRVAIENTKSGASAPVLKATQGDSLTIDITSDRPGTVEIHGYQKKVAVAPGSVATLAFVANIAGRFPVDLHGRDGRHLDVTALEVQPR